MIRYTLLALLIAGVSAFAWRDRFKALCILVLLVSVLERPDMPKSLLGLQGLNPFNIGLLMVLMAWVVGEHLSERSSPAHRWAIPKSTSVMVILFVGVLGLAFTRMFLYPGPLLSTGFGTSVGAFSRLGLFSEYFLNTFKWMAPGLLICLGCDSRERHRWLVVCLVLLYVILAVQTIRQMPLQYLLDGEALEQRAARVLRTRVGYHRVELAGLFAGAFWAIMAAMRLFPAVLARLGLFAAGATILLALALTGGRTGYGAWLVLGLLFASLRWWRVLVVAPVALALGLYFAPGIGQRFLQGLSVDESGASRGGAEADVYTVTAGRSVVWPFVLRGIAARPLVGYGREGFERSGLRAEVLRVSGENFGHPHNGYFQFALDNGLPGLAVALALYLSLAIRGARMFRSPDPECSAAGGMAFALTGALLIAAVGAQTFYPTEASLGLWCVVGVMVRVSAARSIGPRPPTFSGTRKAVGPSRAPTPRWSAPAPVGRRANTFAPPRLTRRFGVTRVAR